MLAPATGAVVVAVVMTALLVLAVWVVMVLVVVVMMMVLGCSILQSCGWQCFELSSHKYVALCWFCLTKHSVCSLG